MLLPIFRACLPERLFWTEQGDATFFHLTIEANTLSLPCA